MYHSHEPRVTLCVDPTVRYAHLRHIGPVCVFDHMSVHVHHNVWYEFEPHRHVHRTSILRPCIIWDDDNPNRNRPFHWWPISLSPSSRLLRIICIFNVSKIYIQNHYFKLNKHVPWMPHWFRRCSRCSPYEHRSLAPCRCIFSPCARIKLSICKMFEHSRLASVAPCHVIVHT